MSRSGLSSIEEQVREHLRAAFGPEPPALVAGVSGGADSMCLLHTLHRLGVTLHVVHVNYQKRGDASDRDAALVAETCEALDVNCRVVTADPGEGTAGGRNFQQWARQVRYQAFDRRRRATGAAAVTTAHHEDDQLETILQKLFRGAGMASWSAMQVWDGALFRPLLEVPRAQIEACCRREGIRYRDDASNFDAGFARNVLRNQWLPAAEEHFPGWRQNIKRVAGQGAVFSAALRYILRDISDGRDRISRRAFLELDPGLQRSLLLYYAGQVAAEGTGEGDRAGISRAALGELHRLRELQTGKSLQLTEHLELMRDREWLKLVVDTGEPAGFLQLQREQLEQPVAFNHLQLALTPFGEPDYDAALYLDADRLEWPLTLRPWRSGDRFQPFGMEGHQSVADHLTNRKVAAAAKDRALVLQSFEETICAVIFPPIENRRPPGTIADHARCGDTTRQCLTIKQIN